MSQDRATRCTGGQANGPTGFCCATTNRRRLIGGALAMASCASLGLPRLAAAARLPVPTSADSISPEYGLALYDEAMRDVVPPDGFRSRIVLGDSVVRLVENGAIDAARLQGSYERRHSMEHVTPDLAAWLPEPETVTAELPGYLRNTLRWPSREPIHLTADNAGHYLMLLWPLGLSNYMVANETSPVVGEYLDQFASTAGWTLGREENGAVYFNRLPIVALSPDQEATVVRIAGNIFRPCCNNSTFYQDCNHGSALLGLLQLGVEQGLDEASLYREALAFNALWFPAKYVETAMFFKIVEGVEWPELRPEIPLGYRYSAIGPWRANVRDTLTRISSLPKPQGQASCSI